MPDEGPEWDAWKDDDWDDQDLDDAFAPPPHQDDRIWRHPAEVAAEARAQQAAEAEHATHEARQQNGNARVLALAMSVLVGSLVLAGTRFTTNETPQSYQQAAPQQEQESDAVGVRVASAVDAQPNGDETSWTDVVFARVEPGLPRIEIIVGGDTAMGGGIVIDNAGHVLTSASFVSGASHIIVWTTDERHVATLVGMDRLTDVAVLSIEAKAQAAALGTDVALQPGQYALVADADANADNAIKVAQITKLRSNAEVEPGRLVHGLLETNIPSESTRPGSAIFDEMGLVIGMTPGGATAGHVLPIDLADRIAREIIEVGQASHAMLGIQGLDNESGSEPGAMVQEIVDGGPASIAGLEPRDVITSMDGYAVGSMDDLVSALRAFEPHQEVGVLMSRDGIVHATRVVLGSDTD